MKSSALFLFALMFFSTPLFSDAKKKTVPNKPDEISGRLKSVEEALKTVDQKNESHEIRLKSLEDGFQKTKEKEEKTEARLKDVEEESEEHEERFKKLEESLANLEKKIDVLGERANMLAARTMGVYKGSYYVRTGATVLFPRSSTFSKKTDTGLGVFGGIGKYVEEQHVAEAGINWEFYPALTLRYRFEWRNKSNTLNLGPILGLQVRLLDRDPLDKYLDPNEELKIIYGVIGIAAGHPIGLSILQTEVLAYFNQQFVIVGSVGLHYML